MNERREGITSFLKELGKGLGFIAVGVAEVAELSYTNKLAEWLSKGYFGDMIWLKDSFSKRCNILEVFPECRSVVVAAEAYRSNINKDIEDEEVAGIIARYATVKDYHKRIKMKLQHLAKELNILVPELKYKIYVDTGPITEKLWAAQVGIGWIGKNSLIITESYGSWILLGVLLLNIDLAPDQPLKIGCGTCNKCIEACPTSAIIEPYVVDARRCISYLTIENKALIPAEYIPKLNKYIFGCDICQSVCMYNNIYSNYLSEKDILPMYYTIGDLKAILGYSNIEFRKQFYDYPIGRIGINRLKRNIQAVLSFS